MDFPKLFICCFAKSWAIPKIQPREKVYGCFLWRHTQNAHIQGQCYNFVYICCKHICRLLKFTSWLDQNHFCGTGDAFFKEKLKILTETKSDILWRDTKPKGKLWNSLKTGTSKVQSVHTCQKNQDKENYILPYRTLPAKAAIKKPSFRRSYIMQIL